MLALLGIAVMVIGFAVRLNPLLVVAAAALVTGLAAGMSPAAVIAAFGKAFTQNRYLSVVWLVLPVIGLLERYGLQVRARALIARLRHATAGRILLVYLMARQLTAAVGLISLGGHAQMVRPLIAPMAEGRGGGQARSPDRAHAPAHPRLCGGQRQHRGLLRRGRVHRLRLDPSDQEHPGRQRGWRSRRSSCRPGPCPPQGWRC